jgi:hypothetical protein
VYGILPPPLAHPYCRYSIISALMVYKAHLSPHDREKIANCLKDSLAVNFEPCLRALGACALELRGSIVRSLKSILSIVQQFKSNHRLKLGLLEFLSIVGRLPDVSKNLKFTDFKSVFLIFLETTDRSRKSNTPYLVTLAYVVYPLATRVSCSEVGIVETVVCDIACVSPTSLIRFREQIPRYCSVVHAYFARPATRDRTVHHKGIKAIRWRGHTCGERRRVPESVG